MELLTRRTGDGDDGRTGFLSGAAVCGFLVLSMVAALVLGAPVSGGARAQTFQEYEVKAAFLYNITKFVELPEEVFEDAQSPLRICVFGKDPFGESLTALTGKATGTRKIVVKLSTRLEDNDHCQVLFISESERTSLPRILKAARAWKVLTVGDMKGFAEAGGMVNMVTSERKISLEINVDAAESASIKISSKLLKLARIIREAR